jgi:transposase
MFIRKSTQKNSKTGAVYATYRLVRTYRDVFGKVKPETLCNLGSNFSIPEEYWRILTDRIEQLVSGQQFLFEFELPAEVEREAKRLVKILSKRKAVEIKAVPIAELAQISDEQDYQTVNINSLKNSEVRHIGAEYVAYHAVQQLQLLETLTNAGLNKKQVNIAIASIIGRLIIPSSELRTHKYLTQDSALDEVMGTEFSTLDIKQLYAASDLLLSHKEVIETKLYQREQELFNLEEVITLFDITNTYFEGHNNHSGANKGRSKEKRSDCELISLGLLLDGSGFPKKSKILPGNISEPSTLKNMLKTLDSNSGTTIIMDAGIATSDNIAYLQNSGYKYIVVKRNATLVMPDGDQVTVKDTINNKVTVSLVADNTNGCKVFNMQDNLFLENRVLPDGIYIFNSAGESMCYQCINGKYIQLEINENKHHAITSLKHDQLYHNDELAPLFKGYAYINSTVNLYCHSTAKEAKSIEFMNKMSKRFEEELTKIANNLPACDLYADFTEYTPTQSTAIICSDGRVFTNKLSDLITLLIKSDLIIEGFILDVELTQLLQADSVALKLCSGWSGQVNDKPKLQSKLRSLFSHRVQTTKTKVTREYEKIATRIGKLKQIYKSVAHLYTIKITPDKTKYYARFITYIKNNELTQQKQAGIYCLTSNRIDLTADALWNTYTMLTDIESAFRSLKSELGMRPVYHQLERRIDGHIFISVIAYHLLHTIRYQLKIKGIHSSWDTIRQILSMQIRVTTALDLKDGGVVRVRQSSQATIEQKIIYGALEIGSMPCKITKSYFT